MSAAGRCWLWRCGGLLSLTGVLASCGDESATSAPPTPSGSASAASDPAPAGGERLRAILEAEQRRLAIQVLPDDLTSRDAAVRRAAVRALARIGGDGARPGLLQALADDDGEVVQWAAYGLGFWCKADREDTVSALAARGIALLAVERDPAQNLALDHIARAMGSCAAKQSEATLLTWLELPGDVARSAALGLGDVASAKKRLREETIAGLLNLAAGSAARPPVGEALFPIGRVEHVPPSVKGRLLEVATERLSEKSPARFFAVRALGRAGRDAVPELLRVLTTASDFTPAERAEAARNLGRFDRHGRDALAEALLELRPAALSPKPEGADASALLTSDFGVVLAALDALDAPGKAKPVLEKIAGATVPEGAEPAVLRRVAWARCKAAVVLAGKNYRAPLLAGCDVAKEAGPGIGERAVVQVLGRGGKLRGAKLTAFRAILDKGHLRSKQAALELLEKHLEVPGADGLLAQALKSKELGLVGTAAQVLAKQPLLAKDDKARKQARKLLDDGEKKEAAKQGVPTEAVTSALVAALGTSSGDLEVQASVIDALGAIAHQGAAPKLLELCSSTYPTVREHASSALGLLSGKKPECLPPPAGGDLPAELSSLPGENVKIELDSEVGTLQLELDVAAAPVTVARIASLVRDGYYEGNVVHRIVPGFVTQYGAPLGDGFGGPPGKPSLRCETSPSSFAEMTVGMALAGRDTGSSQLFVMHALHPHLDGRYPWVGTASGPWAALIDGDTIRSAKIVE